MSYSVIDGLVLLYKGAETLDEEADEGGEVKEGLSQCMQGGEDCCNSGE